MRTTQNANKITAYTQDCTAIMGGGLQARQKRNYPSSATVPNSSVRCVGLFGAIFVVTALINFCPIYRILGISTKKE